MRRAFANGRLKHTKTRLSNRAVPLQANALEAIDHLQQAENPILLANSRGGRIDFRSFGRRHWKPAQRRAGIDPLRGLYDLRHTYATFVLRAGVPMLAVSRFMGSSIAMIDYHYGHLAHDSREHAVSLLNDLHSNARWTVGGRRRQSGQRLLPQRFPGIFGVDRAAQWTLGGRRDADSSSPW